MGQAEIEDLHAVALAFQILSGVMSRWTTLRAWAAASPAAICRPMRIVSEGGNFAGSS